MSATAGATHTVVNTTVTALKRVNDAFIVSGAGSSINMINTDIRGNLLVGNSPFTGVRLTDTATGVVKRSSFTGNTGVSVSIHSDKHDVRNDPSFVIVFSRFIVWLLFEVKFGPGTH
jgi:hypothetical protein